MKTDKNLIETPIDCEKIFDGNVVHLEKWNVFLPNGKHATREVIRHVGASAVLAVNNNMEVTMVRQCRFALGCVTLEIPAGKLNHKNDDPLEAAKRELSEETGLAAKSWRHLTAIYTTVGFCDEKIDLYLATDLVEGEAHCDEDEFLEVVTLPYQELVKMAVEGQISDAKTVCALLLSKQFLEKSQNSE